MTAAKKGSYGAGDITVLEGLEAVRRRPGMYIGTTGVDGLHHLIWEIFDNSRDEAMGGFADNVEVALLPNNRIRVTDNGRGIPVDMHKKTKVSALETIMTTLHAGAKFGGEGYKYSGGLHGVGVSVVNALSSHVRAEIHRDGGQYVQEYKEGGKVVAKVKKLGSSKKHGTIITFDADPLVFPEIEYNWNTIVEHLRQQAYLVKGMRLTIIDAREYKGELDDTKTFYFQEQKLEVPSMTFYFEGGLKSLVTFQNRHQKEIHKNIFYVEKELDNVHVEVALQYVDDISSRISAFANNTYTPEGGMHLTGFKTALTRTINNYIKKANMKGVEGGFTGDDVLEGLTAVISVKMEEIQFEGQTKAKLGSVEARGAVESVFSSAFNDFLEENPNDAKALIMKAVLAMKARKAAKAAKDSVLRKGALEGMTLPGKLSDCQSRSAEESEIFIVEGDSAGGCFSGDTEVALLDGRNVSFEQLVKEDKKGKKNYCYTIGENGSIEVGLIKYPRITNKDVEVIKVILDNDEEIICTPDHKFMLRNGEYLEAKSLTTNLSLMPLRLQVSQLGKRITIKGYELVFDPESHKWIFTHLLSDSYNVASGLVSLKKKNEVLHHVDFNKRNNSPDNLVRMDKQEHLLFHTQNLEKTLHSEESKQKARDAHKTDEYRQKISAIMTQPHMKEMLSKRAKKQWKDPEYKKYMAQKYKEFYNSNEEYRENNKIRLNTEQKKYWSNLENRKKQSNTTRDFFEQNPDRKDILSDLARKQWNDQELLKWRAETTSKQWTSEFRRKRKESYDKTYLEKGLKTLHDIYNDLGSVDYNIYNEVRRETNDKSIIKHETLASKFFSGDLSKLEEAVVNYNHGIKKIIRIKERMNVYDIEVSGTHNFALASGVFVHNSSKQGRDRRTQAILPLRGKILNVERARLDKMLANNEIRSLVVALGTAIGDTFDIEKLRYHKVIIATDADVDGAHIRTLLLTLFYRYFKPLIEGGFLYIAQPPLYKIKQGKKSSYAYTEEEKIALVGDIEPDEEGEEKAGKISIQRYKGLGEMNPDELWETTMDPERRVMKQVVIEDGREADNVFDTLMGTDVASRKSFIQSHAREATLDI